MQKIKCLFLCGTLISLICQTYTEVPDSLVEHRLFLMGDAGDPVPDDKFMPNYLAMKSRLNISPEKNLMLILGDNIYPKGLPPESDEKYEEYKLILDEQINLAKETGVKMYMIPGNHEWNYYKDGGWEYVVRQQEYVDEHGDGQMEFFPKGGKPGGVIKDFGDYRIVIFDTHWFIHKYAKPFEAREAEVTDSIFTALEKIITESKDKKVIIAAHHPYRTNGIHGGYFNMQDHFFPLTYLNKYLWIPLPIIGSAYVIARNNGISSQDTSGERYSILIERFKKLFEKTPPFAFVSGHEHNLQVLDLGNFYQLVSGSGRAHHLSKLLGEDDMLYGVSQGGFMILNEMKNKSTIIEVWVTDHKGNAQLNYQSVLRKAQHGI
jgi:hypothetical protein